MEETTSKLDSIKNLDNFDREQESTLIAELQDRNIHLERELNRITNLYENTSGQIDTLKAQVRNLLAREQAWSIKYKQKIESTEVNRKIHFLKIFPF